MKRISTISYSLFILILVSWGTGCGGAPGSVMNVEGGSGGSGGAAAPPASIPAPVSAIGVTVSSPDVSGFLLIDGGPGSVTPGATVVATNLGGNSVETLAEEDGSFFLKVPGEDGDVVEIYQELDGEKSDPIRVTAPCGGAESAC